MGEILFNSGHAPANGHLVKITAGTFLVPVRFVGSVQMRVDTALQVSVPTLTLEELFEVYV